jgi:hypothetical protein
LTLQAVGRLHTVFPNIKGTGKKFSSFYVCRFSYKLQNDDKFIDNYMDTDYNNN